MDLTTLLIYSRCSARDYLRLLIPESPTYAVHRVCLKSDKTDGL